MAENKSVRLGSKNPTYLVGGFNPIEKYESNWIMSPGRGEHKEYLKPAPSYRCYFTHFIPFITEQRSKPCFIPLNPGCLIGILIMSYYNPHMC